jgi:hypothetical protein
MEISFTMTMEHSRPAGAAKLAKENAHEQRLFRGTDTEPTWNSDFRRPL